MCSETNGPTEWAPQHHKGQGQREEVSFALRMTFRVQFNSVVSLMTLQTRNTANFPQSAGLLKKLAAKWRKNVGCEKKRRGRDTGERDSWKVSLRSPKAKDKLKQHTQGRISHYARPSLLWALSICLPLTSLCRLWFPSKTRWLFFFLFTRIWKQRKVSNTLFKIIQLRLNVTEGGLTLLPVPTAWGIN